MSRRTAFLLAVLLGGFVLLPVANTMASRSSGPDRADQDGDDPTPAYRVTYEVTEASGRFERQLTVDRPFRARIVDRPADGEEGETVEQRFSLGLHSTRVGEGDWEATATTPRVPPGDTRLLAAARSDEEHEWVVPFGDAEVLGRRCTYYRVGADPFDPEPLDVDVDATSYTEVCIAPGGIMLAWREVRDRRTVSVGAATELNTGAGFSEDLFLVPPDTPLRLPAAGGGAFIEVDEDTKLERPMLVFSSTPEDWSTIARRVTLSPGDATGQDPDRIQGRLVDVIINGPDAVWIVQGPAVPSDGTDSPPGREIDTPVGSATLVPSLGGVQLHFEAPDGQVTRLYSTRPLGELDDVLEQLEFEEPDDTPDETEDTDDS